MVAARITRLMGDSFSYHSTQRTTRLIDYPEISALAAIAVGAKWAWPFEPNLRQGSQTNLRRGSQTNQVSLPHLDWAHWVASATRPSSSQSLSGSKYANITVDDVLAMGAEDFDGYIRHVSTFIEDECESSWVRRPR